MPLLMCALAWVPRECLSTKYSVLRTYLRSLQVEMPALALVGLLLVHPEAVPDIHPSATTSLLQISLLTS